MTCLHGGHVTRAQDGPWHIDQQRQLVALAYYRKFGRLPEAHLRIASPRPNVTQVMLECFAQPGARDNSNAYEHDLL